MAFRRFSSLFRIAGSGSLEEGTSYERVGEGVSVLEGLIHLTMMPFKSEVNLRRSRNRATFIYNFEIFSFRATFTFFC